MKLAFSSLVFTLALLAAACGTSSNTTTGPSLDRCAITATNSNPSIAAAGGGGRITVTAGRECTWSLTSNVPWITPAATGGGQGDGSVDYVVAANPTSESRRGTVVVGGQTIEVAQEGLACMFNLQPTSQNVGSDGGSGSFSVEAPGGCSWTAAASDEWIAIANSGSHNGNGSVSFTVSRNNGGPREGTIRIGGQLFTIAQSAPTCRYQLSAVTATFSGAGGPGSVTVTTIAACAWTASANVPWISIVGNTTGEGNGTVNFSVQANTGPARNGILTIGGQSFTVAQLQAQCDYSIAPAKQSFGMAGGPGSVTVTTGSACTWSTSDVPAWITGIPASGAGSQTIAFTLEANRGPARSAAAVIGGQTLAITQDGGCSYSLSPTSYDASAGGGSSSLDVTTAAGCDWTASGIPAWITGIPAAGTGPRTINFTVSANPDSMTRRADIIIGARTFVVTQAAACSFSVDPTSYHAPAGGGASSFVVNTAAGCSWTSSGVPDWITNVPATGTGTTTINFEVEANTGPDRKESFAIANHTFAVTQANGCSYALAPGELTFNATGGPPQEITVTTHAACAWSATPSHPWIKISSAAGPGSGTITVELESSPGTGRSGHVDVGGEKVTITQNP